MKRILLVAMLALTGFVTACAGEDKKPAETPASTATPPADGTAPAASPAPEAAPAAPAPGK